MSAIKAQTFTKRRWHLGGKDGAKPQEQGFDTYFDSHPNPNQKRDEPEDPKGIYSLTRAAVKFIEANQDRPFFAYVAPHAIHSALEARPTSLEKFKAKKPGAQHQHALYAACLYDLDDGVGLLLRKLKELGLQKNTLVIFSSDNGGPQSSLNTQLEDDLRRLLQQRFGLLQIRRVKAFGKPAVNLREHLPRFGGLVLLLP